MSWMITGAVVMGGAAAGGIGEKNKAAAKAYAQQDALYTSQQRENNIRAIEATEEARRMGYLSIMENKTGMTEAVGKESIRRGEGATAGGSAARSLTTLTINTNKAINSEQLKQRKELINMWQQNEETNFKIQQAKEQARAAAKAGQTTGMQAFSQIAQGAISGGQMGAKFGSTSLGQSSAASLNGMFSSSSPSTSTGGVVPSGNYANTTSMTYDSNSQFSQNMFASAGG